MLEGFIISIPIFYVLGLVSFIRYIARDKNAVKQDRTSTLKSIIPDLENALSKSDAKQSLESLIAIYTKEIEANESPSAHEASEEPQVTSQEIEQVPYEEEKSSQEEYLPPEYKAAQKQSLQIGLMWSRWYTDNSINLLLYVGAFLIVASAAIFVGFQWDAMPGLIKASAFSLVTLAFFMCGILFYRIESIKNAGFTFISIASILLPFNGIGWYNFHFKEAGFEIGGVWLVTSIVCLSVYLFFTVYLQKTQFVYVMSLALLSIVLSIVNIFQMNREFYILGMVFTSFVLFLTNRALSTNREHAISSEPLLVSAHVLLPISLVFGLVFALDQGRLLSYETALTLLLSAVFYVLSYVFYKRAEFIFACQILFPISLYVFLRASDFDPAQAVVVTQIVPILYLFIRKYIPRDADFVRLTTMHLALGLGVAGFVTNLIFHEPFGLGTSLSILILSIHFFITYFVEKNIVFMVFSLSALSGFVYFFLNWTGIDQVFAFMAVQMLGVLYIAIAYHVDSWNIEKEYMLLLSRVLVPVSGLLGVGYIFVNGGSIYGNGLIFGLIALIFYVLCYYFLRFYYYFFISSALLLVVIFVLCRFVGVPLLLSLNIVQVLGILYAIASYQLGERVSGEKVSLVSISNGVLPALGFGIGVIATQSSDGFFVKEVVFSSFLGVLYYSINYLKTKSKTYFLLSEVSSVLFITIFMRWAHVEVSHILYALNIVFAAFLALGYLFRKIHNDESYISILVGVFGSVLVFLAHIIFVGSDGLFYFALFPAVYSLVSFVLLRSEGLFGGYLFFQCVAVFLFGQEFLENTAGMEMIAFIYLAFCVFYYGLIFFVKNERTQNMLLAGTAINGFLAHVFGVRVAGYELIVASVEGVIAYSWYVITNKSYGFFAGLLMSILAMFVFGYVWPESAFQPILFVALYSFVYGLFAVQRAGAFATRIRNISLTGALATVLFFFMVKYIMTDLGIPALISSYFLTILFAFDAYYVREKNFGYIASIIGMFTYFWQVYVLGQTEYQVYLLPMGVYFLVLSYFTRNEKNRDIPKSFTYGGLFILLVPLMFQTFGDQGFYYSILLGVEGMLLLSYGITSSARLYRYIGIASIAASVFSQTYNVLFSLPRWVATAVAGLTFIAVAIFLLLKRKDLK